MKRIRVIPVLLIQDGGLVKSVNFKKHKYVGDPINAVKIFNVKEVDEISIIDISASKNRKGPNYDLIESVAEEAFMPLSYGGGITNIGEVKKILSLGVEKVIINHSAIHNPSLIREIADKFGSQSVVVSLDVKKDWLGRYYVYGNCGKVNTKNKPIRFAQSVEEYGAGEILVTSITQDGTFRGYDLDLINQIANAIDIPLIANGGASSVEDFYRAISHGKASAVAAGSYFVFQQPHRAVLISYPSQEELIKKVFSKI